MRILHINSYYNGSTFYKNLFDQQVQNGLDISVFVPVASPFNSNEDFGEYTTVSVNHSKYDRFLFHLKHFKILSDIKKTYNIKKYSLIHAHSLFSNGYIAMMLKKKYRIPYIVAVRNTDVNTFFKKMVHLRKLGIQILLNADHIIFLSKSYQNEVINSYIPEDKKEIIKNKSTIIPNGIDNFWLKNKLSTSKMHSKNDLKLLYVGVINKNKNIKKTLKAMSILREHGMESKLTIVGKVHDHAIYKQIENDKFLNYIGPKSKEELLQIYNQHDIFVMPSIHESFGLVYLEAMSQGLPVIYSHGQGFDGHFEDGLVGFSVNSSEEQEIAGAILKILANYEAISSNCVINSGKFSWESIAKKYCLLYNLIVK